MKKILYGLGCKCDPHLTQQMFFHQNTAPSLFAGTILLQRESQKFIPMKLFDGDFEKYFFDTRYWKEIERLEYDIFTPKTDGIYRYKQNGMRFQYYNNLQYRRFMCESEIKDIKFVPKKNHRCYINEHLGIMNIHASDKTPGVDPFQIDYQYKKYEFFLEHMKEFIYTMYIHRNTTQQQICEFYDCVVHLGIDPNNFIIFNRNKNFYNVNFKQIQLPDSRDEQNIQFYSQQREIMRHELKNILNNIGY